MSTLPLPQAVIWDMDGTMIDQTAAIIRCYIDVISSMGYEHPNPHNIRRSLGSTMASTMSLFIENNRLDEACAIFRNRFPKIMLEGLIILPGTLELISQFASAGISQVILTNKDGETARRISDYAHFSAHIPVCIGHSDTRWHKPQYELTKYVLQQIDASPDGTIIIGDSPTDIATGDNANLSCYCVATGAHSVTELKKAGAKIAVRNLLQLKKLFETLRGPV